VAWVGQFLGFKVKVQWADFDYRQMVIIGAAVQLGPKSCFYFLRHKATVSSYSVIALFSIFFLKHFLQKAERT
jgi:hypothetical protein